ncbi:Phosphotyrosyl phosphatase activator [Ramaria rubella]|nr:Phosphotyrosyl phosphatase activator [Ramaria rubella]
MALPSISSSLLTSLSPPTLKIHVDADVEKWQRTSGYQQFILFLRRLNDSVVGYELPLQDNGSDSEAVTKILAMFDELDAWIDDIPPQPTPQRFGNLAFRGYGKRLEERSNDLLQTLLPPSLCTAIPLIRPYFLISFGSFQRLDYGTGHETSFALFLFCLVLLRFFEPEPQEERRLVLCVFVRYLHLVWKIQDVYRLEPAGSHGVWGLDDYGFLGYIFGSGQLRDREDISPAVILQPPLPTTNLYYLSIMRIHQLKHGPFYEHSPQLHSIAQGVLRWSKVNSGMFKMYEAEVLRKRVVVQHIPLGGLLSWEGPAPIRSDDAGRTMATRRPPSSPSAATAVPWASAASATQGSFLVPSTRRPL